MPWPFSCSKPLDIKKRVPLIPSVCASRLACHSNVQMQLPRFPFICGVQEYVESMARTPRSSIRQGSFTPHILGCPQHRKSDAKYPFERKLRPKTPFLREYALFSSRSWARNMRSILPLKSFHFKLLVV